MRTDFDNISNEHIQHIVNQIKQSDYLQMITDNIDIGKYVIPRTMEHIYFNDMFPEMQTLKKERRNDKLVGVHVGNGKWEKRLIDDIFEKIIRRVEDFHTKYFKYIENKYKHVEVGSPRWKQIMRPIKSLGNLLLWYDGFSGDHIENMGIQLNYPDEDDEEDVKSKDRRNKEMEQLISEKVYDKTLSKEKALIW
jgi:c-di-AMP phosphodiesterase-like protein